MTIFQGMNDAVDREIVAECSDGSIKMGWAFQAGAAALTIGGGLAAQRTTGWGQFGEVFGAVGAKQSASAVGAAKKAALWEQVI